MDGQYYNLWSTDNQRTVPNDEVVIKTIYDPSPVGYSLPASNAFTGFTTTGGNVDNRPNPLTPEQRAKFNVKGDFDKGYYFYIKPNKEGKTFWIPANGFRSYITGKMLDSNKYGFILTSGISTTGRERLLVISSDFVMNITDNIKNDGIPVRSAEEKEENVTIFQHLRFVFYYIQKRTSYISYLLYINYFVCYRFCHITMTFVYLFVLTLSI